MPWNILSLSLCFLFALVAFAEAQDATSQAPNATDARTAYNQAAADYKQVFQEIETLRGQYQGADSGARQEINAKLPLLVEEARQKMDAWVTAGLQLYNVAPNEDKQLADWLVGIAKYYALGELYNDKQPSEVGGRFLGGDQYELALPIVQALIDGDHPEKNLYVWGGMSAVCVNDYDLAKEYLAAASDAGLFEGLPQYPSQSTPIDETYLIKARDFQANLDTLREQWEEEQKIRKAETVANDLPRVKFTTTKGDVVIELFENEAPIATANMISLVKSDFYSNVVFHRVLPHFMAQGGDPTGTGSGGPGYSIACECHGPDARHHFRGTLSMAHAGRDTGGSQFFMCFIPTDFLNQRHTAFGRVIEGMEVLGKLQRIDPQAQGPFPTPDKIIKAEVQRDRGHAYEFEKLPER
jgi:cyclophilin family peptidyl-prolyl cis-trans isomerase